MIQDDNKTLNYRGLDYFLSKLKSFFIKKPEGTAGQYLRLKEDGSTEWVSLPPLLEYKGSKTNISEVWNITDANKGDVWSVENDEYFCKTPTTPTDYGQSHWELMGQMVVYGTLNTDNSGTQTPAASESFGGSINLHKISKTGSYNDLLDKPTIPFSQVNSDWNSSSGVSEILNKPNLATVATSGSYTDLINTPSIPAAQVNADWNSTSGVSEILNKPTLFSGSYNDLTDKPSIPPAANDGTYSVKTDINGTITTVSDFTANQSTADDITFVQGANVTLATDATNKKITITATDTTYGLSSTVSGTNGNTKVILTPSTGNADEITIEGTGLMSVTSDNNGKIQVNTTATDNTGTVTSITAGAGLQLASGDTNPITTSGTISVKLASSSEIGGIKVSATTSSETAESISTTANRTYAVQKKSDGTAVVNVPWTDTTYNLATVATSGSYNDLTNKPTIPSVSTSTNYITINGNGSTSGTNINDYVPVGAIQMYVGSTAPTGWLLCNGDGIMCYDGSPIAQTIQSKQFAAGKLQSLINTINSNYGVYTRRKSTANGYIAGGSWSNSDFIISSWTNDASAAHKFYSLPTCYYNGTEVTDLTNYYTVCLPDLTQRFPLGQTSRYNAIKTVYDLLILGTSLDSMISEDGTFKTLSETSTLAIGSQRALCAELAKYYNLNINSAEPYADLITNINSAKFGTLGSSAGEFGQTLTVRELPAHNHSLDSDDTGSETVLDPHTQYTVSDTSGKKGAVLTNNTGGGQAHNNMPPYVAVNFIIKY